MRHLKDTKELSKGCYQSLEQFPENYLKLKSELKGLEVANTVLTALEISLVNRKMITQKSPPRFESKQAFTICT